MISDFNPRSRVGNDTAGALAGAKSGGDFNPRSRVRNDTETWKPHRQHGDQFQSTFPRGERPHHSAPSVITSISIHVPAWGTTHSRRTRHYESSISIHVPAWGTAFLVWLMLCWISFQSTFPRGERRNEDVWLYDIKISIHVPAWGTTII